ncbi:hypothetical protein [Enterovirga rhinocerotis]|uniref:FecR family protein n=1 Tax=Enterovirga rhinocerotis TaxID=1339210 RepID=A0A4R7CBS6_9HYPH|nr:hypothetical protein [Enterovirga rhinocerotis]TDR95899.1 hypothetical protein EV668_0013 [Enterovirga rhinocerotis]
MTPRTVPAVAILLLAGAAIAAPAPEVPPGCRLDDSSTSLLRIYECQEKLRIAAETATRVAAIERDGRLVGVRVDGGAVLVETAGRREGFRIVTAEAVTELRDAAVAVETAPGKTAVFVKGGGASVSRDGGSVSLTAGQGVDVAAARPVAQRPAPAPSRGPAAVPSPAPPPVSGAAPPSAAPGGLEVRTWGRERAGQLLARLGQS